MRIKPQLTREFLTIFSLVISYFFFALLFKPGQLFYEAKIYVYHFASIINDFDFNIINQVPQPMAWLTTPSYFHPDQHSVIQSAFMLPLYILEFLSKKISLTAIPVSAYDFQFSMASLALNLFSLITGFYFINRIIEFLSLRTKISDYIFFTFGSAVFYFSFLQTTVIEIVAFPLLSYSLYAFITLRAGQALHSPITLGIASGFLAITKITFWPVCLIVSATQLKSAFKRKALREVFLFSIPFGGILFFAFSNQYLKYDRLLFDMAPPLNYFLDFSLENFGRNIYYGFFPQGGLFFANPIYFFGLIGLASFVFHLKKQNKVTWPEISLLLGWFFFVFFGHIFIGGYIVEDHLPGRIHLAFLPLLIIGFSYLRTALSARHAAFANLIFALCCIWHLTITVFYIVQIQGSSFDYATNMIPAFDHFLELLPKYFRRISENASGIAAHIVQITVFSFITALLIYVLRRTSLRSRIVQLVMIFAGITFGMMSVLNFYFAPINVAELNRRNYFNGMAVGNGVEIFQIDYILQYVSTMKTRCSPEVCAKLDLGVSRYYSKVSEQILRSIPELERALLEKSLDFSYWIKMEKDKTSQIAN